MTKIVWMSDPHFQDKGRVDGINPRVRLQAAVTYLNTHYADADFAVLSGDLIGDDIMDDYASIAQYLAKSRIPIYPLMGNNDDRAGLRHYLPLPSNAMSDFVQYTIDTPSETIVCLDTHKIGSHAGQFCAARQHWLDDVLRKSPQKPAYIFMHHPPLALGLPPQDEIMLDDNEAFLDLIATHTCVKHLFMGHVHRSTAGSVRGIPFATLAALSFQAPAPRPAWTWDEFKPPKDAPQLGVIQIDQDSVVLQYIQFCDYGVGVDT